MEGVYLLKLKLENIRSFRGNTSLDLSSTEGKWKRWTVILGNNGTGKTTILQVICALQFVEFDMFSKKELLPLIAFDPYYKYALVKGVDNAQLALKTTIETNSEKFDIAISSSKTELTISSTTDSRYGKMVIYGYGANRFMTDKSISDSKSRNSVTLFDDDAKLINAEEWLLQLDYSASKSSSIQDFATKRRGQVKEVLLEILPDIKDIRFTEPTKENLKSTIEFLTPYNKWVTIHQLSLGYKTMVAWMVDLSARLFERYPNEDKPLEQPAIVLVDEIDLHMHPQWQRKIFDYLSEKFPKTQFIVTAHSPLIVQSAPKDANIVLLRREGDHVVIDNDIKSVHNWRIDQILNSELFGNISQRSEEVESWMNRREELVLKGENITEAEKRELAELNEKAYDLPTAEDPLDIEARHLLRQAAKHLKPQTT